MTTKVFEDVASVDLVDALCLNLLFEVFRVHIKVDVGELGDVRMTPPFEDFFSATNVEFHLFTCLKRFFSSSFVDIMADKAGIETENGYYSVFMPVDPIIDQAYFKNYDTLSTTNAMIFILIAFVACVFSFVVFYSASRLTYNKSITQLILTNPSLALGLVMIFLTFFIVWYFNQTRHKLMTNVVPIFTAIIFGSLVGAAFFETSDDQWRITLPGMSLSNVLVYIAVGLMFATLIMYWISSDLRVDRLRFQSPAFFSFVFFVLFFGAGMIYIAGIINDVAQKWVDEGTVSTANFKWVYFAFAFAILISLFVVDTITNTLINLATGFSPKPGNYLAQSPELANATARSKQMVLAVYCVLIFMPFLLVYWFKNGLISDLDRSSSSIGIPIGILAGLFPVLAMVGVSFMETRRFFPALYKLIIALVMGFAFFVLTTQFIPWGNASVVAGIVVLAFASILFLLGRNLGSGFVITMIIGFVFMGVKAVSQAATSGYSSSTSERVLVLGLPILLFAGIWFIYSWRTKQNYLPALTLLFFGLGWAFLYSKENPKDDYILKGKNRLANIGIDYAIVTSILSIVLGLTNFSASLIDSYGNQTERLPVLFTILKVIAVGAFSYLGAYFYDYLITDGNVAQYLDDQQSKAESTAMILSEDLQIAFNIKSKTKFAEKQQAQKRIHFVHIPKTGGSAIKNAFCDDPNFDEINGHDDEEGRDPEKIYFAVIRDPYERYKSLFYYLKEAYELKKEGSDFHKDDLICGEPMVVMGREKFDQLKNIGFEQMQPKDLLEAIRAGRLDSSDEFLFGKPQVWWVSKDLPVDHILRQENLQEDFDKFCDSIGKDRFELPRSRRTRNKSKNPPLDEDARALVRSIYREDFDAFDYPM